MGRLLAKDRIPSCKFLYPKNGAVLPANTTFTVKLATRNLESGLFSNSETNYFAAPQTTNANGILRGHSHIVIEKLPNYLSDAPLDPTQFTFFKAMNAAAVDGVLSVDVTGGIGTGIYRLSSVCMHVLDMYESDILDTDYHINQPPACLGCSSTSVTLVTH
jgi:hypothetical protein